MGYILVTFLAWMIFGEELNMLKLLEVNFKGVNVLEDEKLRQGIKEFSDWPTIPQLYIKKEQEYWSQDAG